MVLALHLQRGVVADQLARLLDPAVSGEHLAGHDEGLRLGPRLDKAAIHQQLVGPRLHCACATTRADKRRQRVSSSPAETIRPTARPHHKPMAPNLNKNPSATALPSPNTQ